MVASFKTSPVPPAAAGQDMGALTIQAIEGLQNTVNNVYGCSDDQSRSRCTYSAE